MIEPLEKLDYIAVGIYIVLITIIGMSFGRSVKDINSYFRGRGTIPWGVATISNFMTLFSTFVFVAYAGIAFEHGFVAITVFWATVPACIIAGTLFAKRWRRMGRTTPMDYLEDRYSLSVRQTITWGGLLLRFLDNMVRLYVIGIVIATLTPLSVVSAIVLAGVIITFFNIIGGFWSVVVMNAVQFFVFLLATFILLPLSLTEIGGIDVLAEKLPNHLRPLNGPKGNLFWLFIFYLSTIFKYNGNWTFIQQLNAVRDEKSAMRVGVFTGIMFFVLMPMFLFPTVVSPLIVPDIPDPEMSYIAVSNKLLPAGLMGILFSCMFASTMSTLNSEYNIMSGVLTNDVYKRLINANATEKQLLWVARLSTVTIGLVVILGGIYIKYFGGAFEANKLFTGILAVPLGFPLLFGVLYRHSSSVSAILTVVMGILTGLVLNIIPPISWELATGIEIVVCFVVYFLSGHIFTQSASEQTQTQQLFAVLKTPIKESDKPLIRPEYSREMTGLFVFSLFLSGCLFIGMSLFSIQTLSGKLSFGAGFVCLIGSLSWCIFHKHPIQ